MEIHSCRVRNRASQDYEEAVVAGISKPSFSDWLKTRQIYVVIRAPSSSLGTCESAEFLGTYFSLFLDKGPELQLGIPVGGLQSQRKRKGGRDGQERIEVHSFIYCFMH